MRNSSTRISARFNICSPKHRHIDAKYPSSTWSAARDTLPNSLSHQQLAQGPNIFQSFQLVQVIQDALRRTFVEGLARAIRKLGSDLLCGHRNLRASLGVLNLAGKGLTVFQAHRYPTRPASWIAGLKIIVQSHVNLFR